MNAEPFDVDLVIARLQSLVPGLRKVGGAADYATVRGLNDFAAPCAYVLLAGEKGEAHPNGHAMPDQQSSMVQRVPVTFGVVVAVRNYRASELGMQGKDSLNTILGQVRAALLGWSPPVAGARPCRFVQGDLKQYDTATLLWIDVFQTQHTIGAGA